jgi:hypothetical protein
MRYTNPLDIPKGVCGIYAIIRKGEESWEGDDMGDRYIGSAKDIRARLQGEWSDLRMNKHHNKHLQNAYNLYGKEKFYMTIMQKSCEKYRFQVEEIHIAVSKKMYNLYNIADKTLFVKLTDEQKQKVSDAKKKPIVCMDISGKFIREYACVTDAAKDHGGQTTNISKVCNGLVGNRFQYSCKGTLFCYKKDYDPAIEYEYIEDFVIDRTTLIQQMRKPVIQYDSDWNPIREWSSGTEASIAMGIHPSSVSAVCRKQHCKAGGYNWKFIKEESKQTTNETKTTAK